MALTEKYVTVAGAGAHDGSSEANAWTFAEMITAAPAAGSRVNMKTGSYSSGAVTILAGSAAAPFVIRGYNSTIGDLDNQGRNADGTLNTTNMPDLTLTGSLSMAAYSIIQNLDIIAAISTVMVGPVTIDRCAVISCNVVNTQNNASARTVTLDDGCMMINCDMACTGAAHGVVAFISNESLAIGCRFSGADSDALLGTNDSTIVNCVFYGNAANIGIDVSTINNGLRIIGNTFYNLDTAVRLPNAVNAGFITTINNCCTDCGKWINSQYSATATMSAIIANNRTRDITTLLTGIEGVEFGEVTTDTGGPDTDYVNANAGNFRLIATAPGIGTGLVAYMDIGAYQRVAEAGSSGGSFTFIS